MLHQTSRQRRDRVASVTLERERVGSCMAMRTTGVRPGCLQKLNMRLRQASPPAVP